MTSSSKPPTTTRSPPEVLLKKGYGMECDWLIHIYPLVLSCLKCLWVIPLYSDDPISTCRKVRQGLPLMLHENLKPGPWRKLVKIGDISKECEVVRVDKGSGLLKVPAVPNPTPACVNVQEAALRKFPDIVVATPGCMIDHLCNSMSVHLDELAILILDEADQLLELGFSAKISELVRAASVTCFAGMTSSVFFSLPEDKQEFIISSSINASLNDEVPSVRSAACRAIGVIACFPQIYHSTEVLEKFIHAAERNARDSLVSGRITASWAIANICNSLGHCLDALHA